MRVKLDPSAIIKSQCSNQRFAAPVVVPPPAPKDKGCLSSKADFPGIVQKTGIPVSSANSLSSSVAFEKSTPAPAQISGFFDSSSAFAAL